MWTTTHTGETTASPEAVWHQLELLHSGTPLSARSDRFELHGPFALGTTVSVTPQGQDTFTSTIVEFEPGRRYADRTTYDGLTLLFRHTVTPTAAGGTHVAHTLEIDGAGVEEIGPELGAQISEDFAPTMDDLIAAAERVPSAP